MKMTLRWFGTGYDSVTLDKIRQIPGVKGVITTLYSTKPGERPRFTKDAEAKANTDSPATEKQEEKSDTAEI